MGSLIMCCSFGILCEAPNQIGSSLRNALFLLESWAGVRLSWRMARKDGMIYLSKAPSSVCRHLSIRVNEMRKMPNSSRGKRMQGTHRGWEWGERGACFVTRELSYDYCQSRGRELQSRRTNVLQYMGWKITIWYIRGTCW